MKLRASEEYARERYIVSYDFASSNYLATLGLTYIVEASEEQIVNDIEREFFIFIEKYPLPLLVSAFDAKGYLINFRSKSECSHLLGYLDEDKNIVYSWEMVPDSSIPNFQRDEIYRETVYENVPFETSEALSAKAMKEHKFQKHAISVLILLFTILIPLAWLIGGLLYSAIAFLSTLWAFSALTLKALRFWGIIKVSKSTLEKREKERRMAHHDYHCCLNPKGFERLRNENSDNECRQRTMEEYRKLSVTKEHQAS